MNRIARACFVVLLAGCSSSKIDSRPAVAPTDVTVASSSDKPVSADASPQEIFEKRILPIFKSPDPSSCVQCHLAGVDLKNYILPSHEQTFVSLRDQGLIDLEKPEKSKILALIQMGEGDKSGAALIHQKTRQAEYDAFADWVKRSARDPRLRDLPRMDRGQVAGPKRPVEVIRHERQDRLLTSFTNSIWSMRFRCMGCHTEGTAENKKLVAKHGERVAWFKAEGPEATLAYLRSSKLIDVDQPEMSLLLRKPLNDIKHGGGIKILPGDEGYKLIRGFLDDYARIVKDQYADAASLPNADPIKSRFGSDIWLKFADTPDAWGDKLLQVRVYAWDVTTSSWETEPIATSDRAVWGKGKLWQHNLTLLAAGNSQRAMAWARAAQPSLPRGRYLLKVHIDQNGRLAKDWTAVLSEDDYAGKVEIESSWPEGYGKMTTVDAAKVRK